MLGYYKVLKDGKETTSANLIKFKVECRSHTNLVDKKTATSQTRLETFVADNNLID